MGCKFCSREIINRGSLVAHEKACKVNPKRVSQYRSPDAGAHKGYVPWNKGKKVGKNPIWETKFPLKDVLVVDSTYCRTNLRRRILANNLIVYCCKLCGIGPEWNGKPMPLILDHINGVNNDNRLDNLRFVCSNCDTQLDTYKSKNRRGA